MINLKNMAINYGRAINKFIMTMVPRGLDDYGSDGKSKGLIVHSTIAVTPNGIVQGLLDQKIWARDPR
jgi:hypothetical protein